jgi:hypothetical protein
LFGGINKHWEPEFKQFFMENLLDKTPLATNTTKANQEKDG